MLRQSVTSEIARYISAGLQLQTRSAATASQNSHGLTRCGSGLVGTAIAWG